MKNVRTWVVPILVAGALAAPGPAAAAVREGAGSDPVGDVVAGVPAQDLVAATVVHDDAAGTITVTTTVGADFAGGPSTQFVFALRSYAAPGQCTGDAASLIGNSGDSGALSFVDGQAAPATNTRNGRTITFSATRPGFQHRVWTCMTVALRDPNASAVRFDELDVPVWMTGSGPDGDGDGKADNVDACPAVASAEPDGCAPKPQPQPQPQPVAPAPAPAPAPIPVLPPPVTTTTTSGPRVPAACARLRGARRSTCARRQAALARCRKVKNAKKRAACTRKARAIGRKKAKR